MSVWLIFATAISCYVASRFSWKIAYWLRQRIAPTPDPDNPYDLLVSAMTNFEALGFAVCILCALAGGSLIAGLLSSLVPLNFGANLPTQLLTLSPLAIALVLSLVFRNRQRRGDRAAGTLEEIE